MKSRPVLTPNDVRRRYNEQAEQYQSRYVGLKGEYYRRFEDAIFLDFLDPAGKRILDLGTGRGRLALLLAERAREVVGIDISEEMIRYANEAGAGRPNLRFELGNALKLTYPDKHFEIVSSMGMFPYVQELQPFLREINRVLRVGGPLAFSVANAGEWTLAQNTYGFSYRLLRKLRNQPVADQPESALIPHDLDVLASELEQAGFELVTRRSTFFFTPSRIFYWAGRRDAPVLKSLAARFNNLLGRLPWTRDHGKVAVLLARKKRDV